MKLHLQNFYRISWLFYMYWQPHKPGNFRSSLFDMLTWTAPCCKPSTPLPCYMLKTKTIYLFLQILTNVHLVLMTVILIYLKQHVQTLLDHSPVRVILVTQGTEERVQVCRTQWRRQGGQIPPQNYFLPPPPHFAPRPPPPVLDNFSRNH